MLCDDMRAKRAMHAPQHRKSCCSMTKFAGWCIQPMSDSRRSSLPIWSPPCLGACAPNASSPLRYFASPQLQVADARKQCMRIRTGSTVVRRTHLQTQLPL